MRHLGIEIDKNKAREITEASPLKKQKGTAAIKGMPLISLTNKQGKKQQARTSKKIRSRNCPLCFLNRTIGILTVLPY